MDPMKLRRISRGATALIGIGAIACASTNASPPQCPDKAEVPISVTRDSIGPLALGETLATLREICPSAVDTVSISLEGYRSPALLFRFADLTVLAVQFTSTLDVSKAADMWEIRGSGGRLPRGVSTSATWGELRRAYGRTEGTTELGIPVMHFQSLPGFDFVLQVDDATLSRIDRTGDFSTIPDRTRVEGIGIYPAQ